MIDTCSDVRLDEPRVVDEAMNWATVAKHAVVEWAIATGIQEDTEARVIEAYLGSNNRTKVSRDLQPLITRMYTVALADYLQRNGFCIEGTVEIEERHHQGSSHALGVTLIETAPCVHQSIPQSGLIFVRSATGKRYVVKFETDPLQVRTSTIITVIDDNGQGREFLDGWKRHAEEHAYLRGSAFYASGEPIQMESTKLDDVLMQPETRKQVERLILSFPEQVRRFRRLGLPAKRGIILEGPPGTGKSMLCRALRQHLDCTFIWLTSRHFNDDPADITATWWLARLLKPTVIILEDLDLVAESRDQSSSSYMLGELMALLDGAESNDGILTIATTNRLDVIENALQNRPGRFDGSIHMGPLDAPSRRTLLVRHLHGERVDRSVLERLVEHTEGYTGALLVNLMKSIVERAVEEPGDNGRPHLHITPATVNEVLQELGLRNKRTPTGFLSEQE